MSEIASELEISPSTCSNHLVRVRDELGVQRTAEILVCAARAGLL